MQTPVEPTGEAFWHQAQQIFELSLQIPESDRSQFLKEQCDDNPRLSEVVNDLLNLHTATLSIGTEPGIQSLISVTGDEFLNRWIGRDIGPYRIVEPIGEGGMGAVFLARRNDDQFEKHVAIKLIKGGQLDGRSLRRFVFERGVLARLDHPNIARLIDGGVTEDGFPFLIMDYVVGETVTDFVKSGKLSIKERVALMVRICNAVSHAHRNLVIHCDLKPSNVIVTEDGQPRLIDFGISKLLKSSESAETITAVQSLTLAYASPEHIAGETLSVDSDVYSLGVLLYEMLCERLPFQWSNHSFAHILETLNNELPPAPSTLTRSESISKDLDAIVFQAMNADRGRRYQSVEQFTEDMEHYLAGRPVNARTPHFGYQAVKFIKRNAAAVFVSATLLLMVSILAVVSTWQAFQLRKETAAAQSSEQRMTSGLRFLAGTLNENRYTIGATDPVTLTEILDHTLARADEELENQPLVRARVYREIGRQMYFEKGAELLEQARELTKAHGGVDNVEYLQATLQLGEMAAFGGRLEYAETLLVPIIPWIEALPDNDPGKRSGLISVGILYVNKADFDRAEKYLRAGELLYRKNNDRNCFAGRRPYSNLGFVLTQQKQLEEALWFYSEGMKLCVGEFGREAPSAFWQIMTVGVGNYNLHRFDVAHQHFSEALELAIKRHGPDSSRIFTFQFHLANNLIELGRFEEARRIAEELVSDYMADSVGSESMAITGTLPLYMLGRSYGVLGDALVGLGDKDQGEGILLKSHQILQDSTSDAAVEPFNVLLYRELTIHRLVRFYEAEGKEQEAARFKALVNSDIYVPI